MEFEFELVELEPLPVVSVELEEDELPRWLRFDRLELLPELPEFVLLSIVEPPVVLFSLVVELLLFECLWVFVFFFPV